MSKEQLKTLSDEDILAAAEQIIADEQEALQKSMDEAAPEDKSANPKQEEKMSDEQKDKAKDKKDAQPAPAEMMKSQADIEGKETGGLAPSVQGDQAALMSGSSSKGGSESEANQGNHLESKEASEEGGPASKETQSGDSQDEANKKSKKHLMKDGDPAAEGGGSDGQGQQGSAQDQANPKSVVNMLRKSMEEMTKAIKALNARVASLEVPAAGDKEEMRKSLTQDTIEVLAKSYNKKIRSLESENEEIKKSFSAQLEDLKKSQDALAKENAEFKEKLSKPARTRETATNYDVVSKGNSEDTKPIFKSKAAVLEKLEELRKSGKVTADELISFNASGFMSENVKKQLAK